MRLQGMGSDLRRSGLMRNCGYGFDQGGTMPFMRA